MIDQDQQNWAEQNASLLHQLNPLGVTQAEQTWLYQEADMAKATGAAHLLKGFQFPNQMSQHDFSQFQSWADEFGSAAGYKYYPKPADFMAAMKSGARTYEDVAKIWGKKLPPELGWVKHGMSSGDFQTYKDQNKEQIAARFGSHNVNDTSYSQALDYQHTTNKGMTYGNYGQAFSGPGGAPPPMAAPSQSSMSEVR